MKICLLFFSILSIFSLPSSAQDTTLIKVHFLYGSKPRKAFKHTESKWFGGIHGGHVGIEISDNRVLHFVKGGETRIFPKEDDPVGRFVVSDTNSFWLIFSDTLHKLKRLSILIPIDSIEKRFLDSLSSKYLEESPYDYAFFGMRCASAGYDVLAHLDIVPEYRRAKTIRKVFYPKKLRKRLLKKAKNQNWSVIRTPGTPKRKWESDR